MELQQTEPSNLGLESLLQWSSVIPTTPRGKTICKNNNALYIIDTTINCTLLYTKRESIFSVIFLSFLCCSALHRPKLKALTDCQCTVELSW